MHKQFSCHAELSGSTEPMFVIEVSMKRSQGEGLHKFNV